MYNCFCYVSLFLLIALQLLFLGKRFKCWYQNWWGNATDGSNSLFAHYFTGSAWLSGGVPLPALNWQPLQSTTSGAKIWTASLKDTPAAAIMSKHTSGKMPGLFSKNPHARFVRARYPNFNPETAQWGYSSPDRDELSFNADTVAEWHTPEVGVTPSQRIVDFSTLPNPANAVKNDSTVNVVVDIFVECLSPTHSLTHSPPPPPRCIPTTPGLRVMEVSAQLCGTDLAIGAATPVQGGGRTWTPK